MSDTIECPTCGENEGWLGHTVECVGRQIDVRSGPIDHEGCKRCPDCIRGRQPTAEVLERMAEAIFMRKWGPSFSKPKPTAIEYDLALAAWLAEHREEQT